MVGVICTGYRWRLKSAIHRLLDARTTNPSTRLRVFTYERIGWYQVIKAIQEDIAFAPPVQHDGPAASKGFTLPMMMALPLREHVDAIIKLAHRTANEHMLEITLEKMTNDARDTELQVVPVMSSGREVGKIVGSEVVLDLLADQVAALQALLSRPFEPTLQVCSSHPYASGLQGWPIRMRSIIRHVSKHAQACNYV